MAQIHRYFRHIKKQAVVILSLLVCVVLALVFYFQEGALTFSASSASDETLSAETQSSDDQSQANTPSTIIIVHVDGAVQNPGVYEFTDSNTRVNSALDAAGGLTEDADTTSINLAALITDGQKIYVPTHEEVEAQSVASSGSVVSSGGTVMININTASLAELDTLPGVGESLANAIIQDREDLGPFTCIEDLMRVSGIGEKKYAKIKDYICV